MSCLLSSPNDHLRERLQPLGASDVSGNYFYFKVAFSSDQLLCDDQRPGEKANVHRMIVQHMDSLY